MKLLFDHNVPYGLRRLLLGHSVSLADEMGWAELSNGLLLSAAEIAGFEVLITCDQNLSYQQNLTGRKLALVVLSTNNWKSLRPGIGTIVAAIDSARPGSFNYVEIAQP